jgi:HEAT repeat protein
LKELPLSREPSAIAARGSQTPSTKSFRNRARLKYGVPATALLLLLALPLKAAEVSAPPIGKRAFAALTAGLSATDPDVRALAAEQWGRLGNPAAVKLLLPLLEDPSDAVRVSAAAALHALGDDAGVKPLFVVALRGAAPAVKAKVPPAPAAKGAEKDEDPFAAAEEMKSAARNKVRATAIRVLAEIRPAPLKKMLDRLRDDRDGGVRDAALLALGLLGETRELDRLAEALSDEDPGVRARAAAVLGEVPSPRVSSLLLPLSADKDPRVRAAVMHSLGLTQDPEALEALVGGAKDPDELVRAKAVEALGLLPGDGPVKALEEARATSNTHVELLATAALARHGASEGVLLAQRALSQTDVDARMLAVEVLELIASKDASSVLEAGLDDREARVRVRAAAALLKIVARPAPARAP